MKALNDTMRNRLWASVRTVKHFAADPCCKDLGCVLSWAVDIRGEGFLIQATIHDTAAEAIKFCVALEQARSKWKLLEVRGSGLHLLRVVADNAAQRTVRPHYFNVPIKGSNMAIKQYEVMATSRSCAARILVAEAGVELPREELI